MVWFCGIAARFGESRSRGDEEVEQVQIHRNFRTRMDVPNSRGSSGSMQLHASFLQTNIFRRWFAKMEQHCLTYKLIISIIEQCLF